MQRLTVTHRLTLLANVFLLCQMSRATAESSYEVVDLGTLGGSYSQAGAINNSSQVVGTAGTREDPWGQRGFIWENGVMRDLGTLGGRTCRAFAINDNGEVTGWSSRTFFGLEAPFIWRDGSMIYAGTDDAYAYAINNQGHLAGVFPFINAIQCAMYFDGTTLHNIGDPSSFRMVQANGINDADQIVGYSWSVFKRAAMYYRGQYIDLGTLPGGFQSQATAINNSGQVAGFSTVRVFEENHAFIYQLDDGGLVTARVDLGTAGNGAYARALNNLGLVVGEYYNANNQPRAFYANFTSGIVDLNFMIPGDSGWTLQHATGINDSGEIVGYGLHNGLERAFLLRPSHDPGPTDLFIDESLGYGVAFGDKRIHLELGTPPLRATISPRMEITLPIAGTQRLSIWTAITSLIASTGADLKPTSATTVSRSLAERKLISPSISPEWDAAFSEVGDSVQMSIAVNDDALLMTLFEGLATAFGQPSPDRLVGVFDDISNISGLRQAAQCFLPFPKSPQALLSASAQALTKLTRMSKPERALLMAAVSKALNLEISDSAFEKGFQAFKRVTNLSRITTDLLFLEFVYLDNPDLVEFKVTFEAVK